MLAPTREHTGIFVPLPESGSRILKDDADLRGHYLDALTYMQDLVVPFGDRPESRRLGNSQDLIIDLGQIQEAHFHQDRPLDNHVEENAETARYIGGEGRVKLSEADPAEKEELKRVANAFLQGLYHTYNRVRVL